MHDDDVQPPQLSVTVLTGDESNEYQTANLIYTELWFTYYCSFDEDIYMLSIWQTIHTIVVGVSLVHPDDAGSFASIIADARPR